MPLVSADYRRLPQTKGPEIFEDVKAAYEFVVAKVSGILGGGGRCENIVVVGQSAGEFEPPPKRKTPKKSKKEGGKEGPWIGAKLGEVGAYLSLLCGYCITLLLIAILGYYSIIIVSDPFFNSSKIFGPKPMTKSQIQHFLDEPAGCSPTPAARAFEPNCLSSDLSRNLEYQKPSQEVGKHLLARMALAPWFCRRTCFRNYWEVLTGGRKMGGWKDFPEMVLVHGDKDAVLPYELSANLACVIGKPPFYCCHF